MSLPADSTGSSSCAHDEIIQSIGEQEYSSRMEAKLREYHHLITREAAEHLLSLEMFGPKARLLTIAQADGLSSAFVLRAHVQRVFPPKLTERGASTMRTQRIHISDQSGNGTLVLYDASAQSLDHSILSGDLIEAGPARCRGGEFHLINGGEIKRIQKGRREKLALVSSGNSFGNFEGTICEFLGDFAFKRQSRLDGSAPSSLMSAFMLKQGGQSVRVVVWDSPGYANLLREGMRVELENAMRKNGELHVGSSGRLVYERRESERPKINSVDVSEECVLVSAGHEKVRFSNLSDACLRLGAGAVPEGVSPKTILELKKSEWIGKPLPEKWGK